MHPLLEGFKEFCEENTDETLLEEIQWYDMSLGWFLARGADIETAIDLAVAARYDYGYWQ